MDHFSRIRGLRRPWPSRQARAFTLLEVMLVVVIIGILSSVFAPGLSGLGKRSTLRTEAHAVASLIGAAREHALNTGHCVMMAFSTSAIEVEEITSLNCEGTLSQGAAAGGLDTAHPKAGASEDPIMTDGTALPSMDVRMLRYTASTGVKVVMVSNVSPDPDILVWRPNGYMRGSADEFGTGAGTQSPRDNTMLLKLRTDVPGLNASEREVFVNVRSMGLICVTEGAQTCP